MCGKTLGENIMEKIQGMAPEMSHCCYLTTWSAELQPHGVSTPGEFTQCVVSDELD